MPRGDTDNWGGPRPHAGRKPEGTAAKIKRTVAIAPETDRAIRQAQQPGESYGAVIDRLIAHLLGSTYQADIL